MVEQSIRELQIAEWQKSNRKKFFYTHSTFGVLKSEDPSVETWMYIDEYKDQESYDIFLKAFQENNPDYAEFFKIKKKWESLLVPSSHTGEVLIEKLELRIA